MVLYLVSAGITLNERFIMNGKLKKFPGLSSEVSLVGENTL